MIDKRMMYAQGQRVAKTLDGSRPGYRGSDYGAEARGTGNYSGATDTGDLGSEKANTASTKSAETTSSSPKGNDNDYNYKGPADLGVTTRTVNTIDAPEAKEFIGGVAYDVTPATKAIRERAKVKQAVLNPTVKRNKIFDPISTSFIDPFAPKKNEFGLLDMALLASGLGLFGVKAKTAASVISKGKFAFDKSKQLADFAETIGLTDKNVLDSFTSNFSDKFNSFGKGKKTTTKNNTINNGRRGDEDGEGLASIENQAGNYDEYILLLQKLQSGTISDSERNRYNVLKNTLGI